MKIIEAYQTYDGKLFEDKDDAALHESTQAFRKWYQTNTLYDPDTDNYVNYAEVRDWLTGHKQDLLELLPKLGVAS